MDKSINASDGQDTAIKDSTERKKATFFGPFLATGFVNMCDRVNNGYDSSVNATDSLETA